MTYNVHSVNSASIRLLFQTTSKNMTPPPQKNYCQHGRDIHCRACLSPAFFLLKQTHFTPARKQLAINYVLLLGFLKVNPVMLCSHHSSSPPLPSLLSSSLSMKSTTIPPVIFWSWREHQKESWTGWLINNGLIMCLTVFLALFFIYLFFASGCSEKTYTHSPLMVAIFYMFDFFLLLTIEKNTEQLLIDCVCVSETW